MRLRAGLFLALALSFGASADTSAPEGAAPRMSAPEVLTRAQAAITAAGTIRASMEMVSSYPSEFSSTIDIMASPAGDERAEIVTTINTNSFRSLQVISGGVLWHEQATPVGPIVGRIDVSRVEEELGARRQEYAAPGVIGSNFVFDLAGVARLVEFDRAEVSGPDGEEVHVLSGSLRDEYTSGDDALPAGVIDFYSVVRLRIDARTFLPRRIEMGRDGGRPLLAIDITDIEVNFTPGEDAFEYTPPDGAQVVDRTDWAIAELTGG